MANIQTVIYNPIIHGRFQVLSALWNTMIVRDTVSHNEYTIDCDNWEEKEEMKKWDDGKWVTFLIEKGNKI